MTGWKVTFGLDVAPPPKISPNKSGVMGVLAAVGIGLGASKSSKSIMFAMPVLALWLPPSNASRSPLASALALPSFLFFFLFFLSSSLESLDSPFLSPVDPPPMPAKRALAFSYFLESSFLGSGALGVGLGTPKFPAPDLFN
jgi:hypothetical protein